MLHFHISQSFINISQNIGLQLASIRVVGAVRCVDGLVNVYVTTVHEFVHVTGECRIPEKIFMVL